MPRFRTPGPGTYNIKPDSWAAKTPTTQKAERHERRAARTRIDEKPLLANE